jgi:putative ABC transport system permease protein
MIRRWLRGVLARVLPDKHRQVVLSDFDTEFDQRTKRDGRAAAERWYAAEAAASLPGASRLRVQSWRLGGVARDLAQDGRYAVRQMWNARGFTLAAIVMLAVGLGLVTGAYTVVNGFAFKGWDVPDNHRVFRVARSLEGTPEGAREDDGPTRGLVSHVRQTATRADYAAYSLNNVRLKLDPADEGPGHYLYAFTVGEGFLETLKLGMFRGAGFSATTEPQVVLSHATWRVYLGEDPKAIGRIVTLSGRPARVVGILEPGLTAFGERPVDALTNYAHATGGSARSSVTMAATNPDACCVMVVGRLRDGATRAQALAELAATASAYRSSRGQAALQWAARSTAPGLPDDRGVGLMFILLGAGVVLVWALTCANVGNLFLARGLRRDREMVVRLSLGATRGRLVRQLLTEGLVLAMVAGALAFALAAAVPHGMAQLDDAGAASSVFAPDWLVAVVAGVGTMVTCLIVALAPALQITRRGSGQRGAGSSGRPHMARDIVLAVQIAVALPLVTSAVLITRGVREAVNNQADFALHDTVAASIELPGTVSNDRTARQAFHEALRLQLGDDVALVESAPVSRGAGLTTSVTPAGSPLEFRTTLLPMSPAAFDLLQVAVTRGRLHASDPRALEAVVNEAMARRLAPAGDAVGMVVKLDFDDQTYRIVGVTRDAHLISLGSVEPLFTVWPREQGRATLLARNTPGAADRLKQLVEAAHAGASVIITPLSVSVRATLMTAWTGAAVAAGLAGIALVLAVIGIFGVFSYLIEARRREIGIRVALGATRQQVRLAVLRHCRRPVVGGLTIGVLLAVLAGQMLRRYLYGLSPLDGISLSLAAAVLLVAAILATAVPVRRALRVDPVIALRAE